MLKGIVCGNKSTTKFSWSARQKSSSYVSMWPLWPHRSAWTLCSIDFPNQQLSSTKVSLTNRTRGAFLSAGQEDVALGATRSLRESQDLWCELGLKYRIADMGIGSTCLLERKWLCLLSANCAARRLLFEGMNLHWAHAENKNKLVANADTSWAQRLSIRLEKCPCQSNCTYYVFDGFCPGLQDQPFVRKWSRKFPMNEYQSSWLLPCSVPQYKTAFPARTWNPCPACTWIIPFWPSSMWTRWLWLRKSFGKPRSLYQWFD